MKNTILRKTTLLLTAFCACAAGLLAGCADDDTDTARLVAAKVTLTLTKYYNEKGVATLPAWEASDRGTIWVDGATEAVHAAPTMTGAQSSLFVFNFVAPVGADVHIVGRYPADADVRYADGVLVSTVPAEQTGRITPCMAGLGVVRTCAYTPYELELKPSHSTMYVSVAQGDYAIARVVVTANGGEAIAGEVRTSPEDGTVTATDKTITVTLPQPVDCSVEGQLIPLMIAPVTLSQGYTVTLTDTQNNTYSVKSSDPVTLTAGGKLDTEDNPSRTISLGTYNLWVSGSGSGAYAWMWRRSLLAQSIMDNGWDIFGFQEANATIQAELPALVEELEGRYEWWFVGRDAQDGSSGEAIGLAYNPDRFELSNHHFFWISETPDELSYGWNETDYHRIACCATVTDKYYNRRFFMMVTHSPLAETARNEGAKLLVEREKMYNTENLPSILVGDMNAHMDEASAVTLRSHWSDSFLTINPGLRSGPVGTFNNHDTGKDLSVSKARIDYIYYRGSMEITSYRCDDTLYKDIYPSDHCPVSIRMYLDSSASANPAPAAGGARRP